MKFVLFFLGLIFSSTLLAYDCSSSEPFTYDVPVSLKGGWYFIKGDNPGWKELDLEEVGWLKKTMPDYTKDPEKRAFGFYWYRCHIIFSSENLPKSLAVNLGKIRDAEEVYWNGVLIGATGKFIPSVEVDIEKDRIYSIPDYLLREGKNVLAIRTYASSRYYGLKNIPEIGNELSIIEKNIKSYVFPVVSGFVFILMGFFFIIGSIVSSKNQSNFFFSLFSIFLGFYTLLRTHFRYEFFSNFALSYSIELVLLFSLPILFINFLTQYLEVKRKKFTYLYDLFQIGLICVAFFSRTPNKWEILIDLNASLIVIPVVYVTYLIVRTYRVSPRKIRYVFIGSLGLLPCVLLDTLKALEFLRIDSTLHFGFLFFLVNISVQISEEMVQNYKNYLQQESELIKMERVKTNFIFNVSNEFRSYLDKALEICKNILEKPKLEKEIIEDLTKLENLSSLTRSIIYDAVVLNSIESDQYEIFTERFSLKNLLEEIIFLLKSRYSQNRENIYLQIALDLELQHNKELIFLVFYHILENEFLYTPLDAKITITITSDKKFFTCDIKDEGPGIDTILDIFKKFVRGNIAIEKKIAGSGIGLTLSKAICERLGGSLSLSSIVGVGTEIHIELPIEFKG
jgi:signal transduction histidine kinase